MNANSSPTVPKPAEPLTYSVTEAAAALGVSPTTIYRLIQRRILKPISSIRHKRISRKELQALVEGGNSSS